MKFHSHFSFETLPLKCGLLQKLLKDETVFSLIKYKHFTLWSEDDFVITDTCYAERWYSFGM